MHRSGREANVLPLMTSDRRFVTSCAWCDRIRVHGTWLERDVALGLRRRLAQPEPLFTHGICERCLGRLLDSGAGDSESEGPRAA